MLGGTLEGVLCLMAKGRDKTADSLLPVLEFFRARQQTGLLSVERLRNGQLEEGEIYLRAGRPVYAAAGQLAGQDALNLLLTWSPIRFAFFADAPYPMRSDSSSLPAARLTPLLPGVVRGESDPQLPLAPEKVNDDAAGYIGISTYGSSYKPGLEWLVPRRLSNDLSVLSLLSRRQRSVYLLVDGRRTVADLARCTKKSVQEIERILIELQEQGLVAI